MRKRIPALMAATALLVLSLTGCGAKTQEIKMVATEMKFEPSMIQAKPGEILKVTLQNNGSVLHEIEGDNIEFEELEAEPGETKTTTIKVPDKPGEYTMACYQKGHKEMGMTATIVVK